MDDTTFVLYTRERCPLCDKAKDILARFSAETGAGYKEVDIYSDDELIEKYGMMIPVLECKGEVIQYGKLDYGGLFDYF